jgi:hypothetical protein
MKTVYQCQDPNKYDSNDPYLVMQRHPDRRTDVIMQSVPNVSDAGNVAEELQLETKRGHDYVTSYYFTPAGTVDEILPLPGKIK